MLHTNGLIGWWLEHACKLVFLNRFLVPYRASHNVMWVIYHVHDSVHARPPVSHRFEMHLIAPLRHRFELVLIAYLTLVGICAQVCSSADADAAPQS